MGTLASDRRKDIHNLAKVTSENLSLPKVERAEGGIAGNVVLAVQHTPVESFKVEVGNAIAETRVEDLGTAKDLALSLLHEKVKAVSDSKPALPLKIDNDLKSRLDALTENIQNGGSFDEIKKFQDREQGILPQSQIKAAKAILSVIESLKDVSVSKDKKIVSSLYAQVVDILEPDPNNAAAPTLDRNILSSKINSLNNAVDEGSVLKEVLNNNPGKSYAFSNENLEIVQALLLAAENTSNSISEEAKKSVLSPFLRSIGDSLISH